jgi:hypothetical protein
MTQAPVCPYCNQPAVLKQGKEIYGTPRYAASRYFWHCRKDNAWVRCFGKTTRPLGPLADQYLRTAQKQLDELRIMPLWLTADQHQNYEPEDDVARERIRLSAKARVEAFLAMRLEFEKRTVKAVALDLEQCRQAWRALTGVSFADVRNWWYRAGRHRSKSKKRAAGAADEHERSFQTPATHPTTREEHHGRHPPNRK